MAFQTLRLCQAAALTVLLLSFRPTDPALRAPAVPVPAPPPAVQPAPAPVQPAPSPVQEEWTWPEIPENLQVLPSDWPGSRLRAPMTGFARALGVGCSHCHVGEADAPLAAWSRGRGGG